MEETNVNDAAANPLDQIDFGKIFRVLKKSIIWVIFIMLFTNTLTFLYIRYTKPIYQSSSIIKIEIESEASALGLANPSLTVGGGVGLSGEIELLKSKLFFGRVTDVINYDVSYHYYGRYLTDERYRNSPFVVKYREIPDSFYDKAIDIQIIDNDTYEIAVGNGDRKKLQRNKFYEFVDLNGFKFSIDKTKYFQEKSSIGKYYFVLNSRDKVIDYLKSNVTVAPENFKANTVRISLEDFNVQKANDFVNAIDTLYLSYIKETKNKTVAQKIDFLDKQIDITNDKLEGYESYFERFTIKNRTINLQNDISQAINLLDVLDSQRVDKRFKLDNIRQIEKQLSNSNLDVINPLVAQGLPSLIENKIQEYAALTSERKQKLESYNESTLVITQLDYKIKDVRDGAKSLISEYKEILQDQLRIVDKQKRAINNDFNELPGRSTEYNKNQRVYSLQETFLLSLRQRKIELQIAIAGTVNKSVILASASTPVTPIHPKKFFVYAGGLIAGIFLSLLFVGIRYFMQNTITSLKELEGLTKVPVLGAVPVYKKQKISVSKMVIDENPKSAISESFRSIRTNMDFLNADNNNKLITITSTVSGEGKTFVGVNLAAIIAISGKRVCVVDLDMRKPKVNLAFEDEFIDEKGVSTVLIGRYEIEECIRPTRLESLSYIAAGPTPPNPSELLLSKRFDEMVANLQESFDIIVFDTPPVGLVTDGVLVMKRSDLQIYVTRADYSKREYVKTLNNLVALNKFSNLTVVLNSLASAGSSSYGYSYGYGYGYYEEDAEESPKDKLKSIFKIF